MLFEENKMNEEEGGRRKRREEMCSKGMGKGKGKGRRERERRGVCMVTVTGTIDKKREARASHAKIGSFIHSFVRFPCKFRI